MDSNCKNLLKKYSLKLEVLSKINLHSTIIFLRFVWNKSFHTFLSKESSSLVFTIDRVQEWINNEYYLPLILKNKCNRVIGVIVGKKAEDTLHICHLYIHPNYQNKGIGRFLINSILLDTDKLNKLTLRVFEANRNAINFYSSQGFNIISKREAVFGRERTISILMEKQINYTPTF